MPSSHTHARGLSLEESGKITRAITTLSVAVAAVLVLLKGAVWLQSGSVALLASLADSGLDLVASLGTFAAVRYAAEPPDQEHRFGHGKAEAFASLIQAGLVFASAALVGREAIDHMLHPHPIQNQVWAMASMVAAAILTALLVTAQSRALKKANSVAVSGDRAHYVADLISIMAALAGIGGAMLTGLSVLDSFAGLVVALWLVWGAVGVFREASVELMDHELDPESRALIKQTALDDPRILDVHQLRTRASGPIIHIQFHAELPPEISLIDAHTAVVDCENRLLKVFPASDIIIHPDPQGRAEPHGGAFPERA